MGDTSGAKHKHIFYNPSRHGIKSGKKPQKALERYADLMKKQAKQGETKWIKKTMVKCQARIKKMGITQTKLDDVLAKK
ncbi:MAG: hypothetical protein WCJ39_01630 [bacterium]